jgi:HEAT repeat protein
VPALGKTLHGEDIWARQPAAWALREIGGDSAPATDALVKALGTGWSGGAYSGACGYHAARALAGIGKPAVPKLLGAFNGRKNAAQRRAAAGALGLIGPDAAEGVPVLIQALQDASPLTRSEAALALGRIKPGAPEVAAALAEVMADQDYSVRARAAGALGECAKSSKEAVAALEKALADGKKEVRYSAFRSLGNGGGAAVPVLVAALGSPEAWNRKYAARALGDAAKGKGGEAAVAALVEALADADAEVRREAVWSLALIGGGAGSAESALKKAETRDADYVVRYAAGEALKRILGD